MTQFKISHRLCLEVADLNAAAIILAGGKNQRMKKNKALLQLGEKKIIERIIDQIRPLVAQVIISTNSPDEYSWLGFPAVADIIPGRGPLSGIHAGLISSPYELNLVVACDMPFVSRELGEMMLRRAEDCDVLVPLIDGRPQPLFAVYSRTCVKPIEILLLTGNNRCSALYPRVKTRYLEEEEIKTLPDWEAFFFNVNTPEEFDRASSLAERLGIQGKTPTNQEENNDRH